jgi:hypothetical protein
LNLRPGRECHFEAKAASEKLGIARSSISRILNTSDRKTSSQGYTFEVIDEAKWEALKAAAGASSSGSTGVGFA